MLLRFCNKKAAGLALSLLLSVSIEAQTFEYIHRPDAVFYIDLSKSFQLQNLQNKSSYPFSGSFMDKNEEIRGFNAGLSLYFFKNLGFDLVLSQYGLDPDTLGMNAQTATKYPEDQTEVFANTPFKIKTVSTGITYRLRLGKLALEPKFMIGASFLNTPPTEIYFFNNDAHYKTNEYTKSVASTISFAPSVNLNYIFRLDRHFGMGIQVSCEYLYMRPDIDVKMNSYDVTNKTIVSKNMALSPVIGIWTIHAGIIFKINKAVSPVRDHTSATK
jgi:hypothetical protein